ncbi:FKBP-type peptidyl-prolyl cis-trans isomerase [Candidatus Enterovibrio escicola]|uniref:FKBP-type peptidyl-prolyl cis-trans isomerase n=1 Tax=Candidatus Enterovibrio escicola TaxID=1927127 RepID=UPI001237A917|nr:FKBP-type peptidyl-prolyl cis-trans isomerase [Candidatus Enterovibrio escacola]
MKLVFKVSLLAVTVALALGCQQEEAQETKTENMEASVVEETITFATEADKAAYAIGRSMAQYLKINLEKQEQMGFALNSDFVLQGVQDFFANTSKLSEEEAQASLQALDQRVVAMAQKKAQENSVVTVKAGEDFRVEFAKREGVTITDSGLMYQVEMLGEGSKPSAEDRVVVHYKGTLINGTQFDSSYDRGQPMSFELNRVIKGWTEGIQLMPVGSKFKFVIPPELAYGSEKTPVIPVNSTLLFDIELLEIKVKPEKDEQTHG